MPRSDQGSAHELSVAGRERCALSATRHGVYGLVEQGLLPQCVSCPPGIAERCPAASADGGPCAVLGAFRVRVLAELEAELEERGGHLRAHEWPLVVDYAKTLTVLMRIDQVVAAEGTEVTVVREVAAAPKKPGEAYARKSVALALHPLLELRREWAALALRQAESLGLSPIGRSRLGLPVGAGSGAKPVQSLDQIAKETAASASPAPEVPHA